MSRLGRGGMGVVYRATDTRTGIDVALKAPRERGDAGERAERLRRVLREARTVVRLAHPHIVRVLGAFEQGGAPWIVMELVDGEPLSAPLDRGVLFTPAEIARHGAALASALAYAHAQGVLHGDVAPDNVLLGRDGAARLSDFGLARPASRPSIPSPDSSFGVGGGAPALQTVGTGAARTVSGTLPYIAPEVIEARAPDPRSDLFSLGAVLYEMAAGTPPFTGDGPEAMADAILRDEPSPIAASGRAIPEELERILRRSLAKDPASRYPTAAEIEADLRALGRPLD